MKHLLKCLLLLFCLTLLMSVQPAQAARISQAERTLYKEGAAAFLDLVSHKSIGPIYAQSGYSQLTVWCPEGPVVALDSDEYAAQTTYTIRMQETNGVGFTIEAAEHFVYEPWGDVIKAWPANFERDPYVPAYGSFSYGAGCPRMGNFHYEIIVISGVDDNGHELEFYGIVERLNFTTEESASSTVADEAHDTQNLRYNAAFEVEVAEGVWWVPAVSLGQSAYTNNEIAQMVNLSPENKQEKLNTLYEALQMFQIGNFANGNDNQRIRESNINWEHHKPGYHAVRTNEGCCATDSNWLNYILKGNYEQVGFLAYSQSDGNGHVFNYIYHDGYYYFIDLTHYRTDFLDSTAPESGQLGDYYNSDYVAGNIHKVTSPEVYVNYCRSTYNDPPELFFIYQAEDCLPVDSVRNGNEMCITYANTVDIEVVYDDPQDNLTYAFVNPPKKKYNWAAQATAKFKVDPMYTKADAVGTTVEPEFFQVGDVVSLEEYGQEATFALINDEDYFLCGMKSECAFSFEEDIMLYGGCHYGYLGYDLPVHEHEEAFATMDSVRLGELMIDLMGNGQNIQVARCLEKDNTLVVTDVIKDDHYFEPIYLYKGDNGYWHSSEKLWYIIHYEVDGELRKEYGRFYCGGEQP